VRSGEQTYGDLRPAPGEAIASQRIELPEISASQPGIIARIVLSCPERLELSKSAGWIN
jgi:hypothetical protein